MRPLALGLCWALLSLAAAQRITMPTGGTVVFEVSAADSGIAEPQPHGTSLRLQRQGGRVVIVEASRSPWLPEAPFTLEANLAVVGNQSPPFSTGFVPITTRPTELFRIGDPVADVRVEYRLQLTAPLVSGTYETTITYRVDSDSVSQQLRVIVAPALELRFGGLAAGETPRLSFDYGAQPLRYLEAVTEGGELPPTGATFQALEVLSSDPQGFILQLALEGGVLERSLLYRLGTPVHGSTIRGFGATRGYEPILEVDEFRLRPTGAEAPGEYRLVLFYTLSSP